MHNEPDHWCYQPETEGMNETALIQWKNRTLPMEVGPDGHQRLSQCKMYNFSSEGVIDCPMGWSYNRTDLHSTIPSDYDWVCSKNGYLTLMYTICSIGGLLGNIVFGPLADKFGRKTIYFTGFVLSLLFGFLGLFTPGNYPLYLTMNFISAFGTTGELLFLVLAELCDDEFRSWSLSFTSAAWVLGLCATPYVAYWAQDWFIIGLATNIPCAFLLLYVFVLPESPRWLISVGRTREAATLIKKIAKVNGTTEYIDEDKMQSTLDQVYKNQAQTQNGNVGTTEMETTMADSIPKFWTLFTKRNVFRITALLTIESIGTDMLYAGITLNTPNLAGNQFLNFFLLGLIELPSSFLAGYLVGTLGRRWTLALAFFLSAVASITAAVVIGNPNLSTVVTATVFMSKFTINITFVGHTLRLCELFPTPLRSTGGAIISLAAGTVSLLTPSMVYLGKYYAAAPHVAMGALALFSCTAALFLPETLNQTLPETIDQSNEFGKYDKFWSIKPRKKTRSIKYGSLRKVPGPMTTAHEA